MKFKLLQFFIKIFYHKCDLPRSWVYKAASLMSSLHYDNSVKKNKILKPKNSLGNVDQSFLFSGYKKFNLSNEVHIKKLVANCLSIFKEKLSTYNDEYFIKNPRKRFLLTIESDEDLLANDEVGNFIRSPYVMDHIQNYFQSPFVLSTIRLWWSPVNTSSTSSQLFHLDEEDESQLKLFINITDVNQESGPFTFLPADSSAKIITQKGINKRRYSDDLVYNIVDKKEEIALSGQAGSGAFVDSSRCLHFGSRGNDKDRLVLMAQFLKTSAPLLRNAIPLKT